MEATDPSSSNQICVSCGIKSPQTETNYTLISSRHGWRLSLDTGPNGERTPIWRCPKCWQMYRKRPSTTP